MQILSSGAITFSIEPVKIASLHFWMPRYRVRSSCLDNLFTSVTGVLCLISSHRQTAMCGEENPGFCWIEQWGG